MRILILLALASVAFACSYPSGGSAGAPLSTPAPAPCMAPCSAPDFAEGYDAVEESDFKSVAEAPLSTYSIDVDTASYSNVRRFLMHDRLPPADAVRVEEMINYFAYDYAEPQGDTPLAASTEVVECPWNRDNLLVRVGLNTRAIPVSERPACNLVFLLDVSGSMSSADKLPLLKRSLHLLVSQLREDDRVSMVVYAGAAGMVLPATTGSDATTILAAIEELESGGSTNAGDGIRLAYKLARENLRPDGVNRVLLATDGDFNVGTTDRDELIGLIRRQANAGIDLTVLGFGTGNLKDGTMEQLANQGNGHYAYIDSVQEARKVLVDQLGSTLVTLAKDVKIQVEFNPEHVSSYKLIGYENRLLAARDFNDDTKDAGEIGAGHAVTALYEIVPTTYGQGVDTLRYQRTGAEPTEARSNELLHLKVRFKEPTESQSRLLTWPVAHTRAPFASATADTRFAAAVASFGMLLRDSKHRGTATYSDVIDWASNARGTDAQGLRTSFVALAMRAQAISKKGVAGP